MKNKINPKEESKKNIDALRRRVPGQLFCPMCHGNSFTVIDGFVRNDIQTSAEEFHFGGPCVPTMLVICNNCGFVSQHAIGIIRDDISLTGEPNGKD